MEFRSASASVVLTGMVVGACLAWHLPQDLAAEQSVLSGLLLSKDAIADVLERLRPRREPKLRTIGRTYGHLD